MTSSVGTVTLEQAKLLVRLLETGLQAEADKLVQDIAKVEQGELFDSIGKLTRQLHDSLQDFLEDPRLVKLTADELPDAQSRLEYVIQRTEEAANRTMDAVESSLPLVEEMATDVTAMQPSWNKLMQRNLELSEFKELCRQVNSFIQRSAENSQKLHAQLTEVLMAQDFQDLTGQVISRVIDLVQEVEGQLVHLLTLFGEDTDKAPETDADSKSKKKITGVEGPIIDPESRDDVVSGQTDVDDLLSSLGF